MSEQKRQCEIYLLLVLGTCILLGILAFFTQREKSAAYQVLQKGFTAFPVIAAVLTRCITKDKTKWHISLKVWKSPRLWAFCAFVPSILIMVGAVLYFLLFPEQYSGVFAFGSLIGTDAVTRISNPFAFGAVCILISALCIPVQLLELGEEIGWREYLLTKQIAMYGVRKGVLLNGFYWGIAHLPLIYFGFNYSLQNAGAPWSNMAMMILVCMTVGIICSYVYVKSNNVMYSAIVHGTINLIGEVPVFLSVSLKSGLLGPNPTGIVGMAGLILGAVVIFICFGRLNSVVSLSEVDIADGNYSKAEKYFRKM